MAGTGVISLSNVVARGVGLAASVSIAAMLMPGRLGEFAILSISGALFGAVGALGFGPLVTRAIAEAPTAGRARVVASSTAALSTIILLGLGSALAVIGPLHWPLDLPAVDDRARIFLISIWGFGMALNPLLVAVAAGHQAFRTCAMLNVCRAVVVGCGTIGGCAVEMTAWSAAVGATGGEVAVLMGSWLYFRRRGWVSLGSTAWSGRMHLLSQGATSGAASLAIQLGLWLGQVNLAASADGLVASGAFLLASRLILIVTLLPNAIAITALPRLADPNLSRDDRGRQRRSVLVAGVTTALITGAVMAVLATIMLPLLSKEYASFKSTIVIMTAAGVMMSINNILGSLAVAEKRIRAWVMSDWVLAVFLVMGAVVIVPHAGVTALAFTHLIAYVLSVVWLALDKTVDKRLVGM